jgi:ABC-type antimicrobial peptide transport system permease subunit
MTLEDHVGTVLMPQRLGLVLMMAFAAAALVLASAGVYAIAASAVAARRREIGIRMALGAGRGRVLRQIIREGSAPVLIGAAAGIGIQMWAATLAESFVFGLDARAPLQLAAAAAVVIAAALVALSLPARRAASIEPTIALRE